MNDDLFPKKVLPPIPPKPPRLSAKYLSRSTTTAPQFYKNSIPIMSSICENTVQRSKVVEETPKDSPIYDNVIFSNNDNNNHTHSPSPDVTTVSNNTHACVPNIDEPRNDEIVCGSLGPVQCPDKCIVMTTGLNINKISELESRTNNIDDKVRIDIAVVDTPGNLPVHEDPDGGSFSSINFDDDPQTIINNNMKSLPIRPEVEGCLNDEHINKDEHELNTNVGGFEYINSMDFDKMPKTHTVVNMKQNFGISNNNLIVHRSINGITTIEIDPQQQQPLLLPKNLLLPFPSPSVIHHVINLPPRRANSINRRRRRTEDLSYQKATRLSQFMETEYKTNCTDRPNGSSNTGRTLSANSIGLINKTNQNSSLELYKNNVEAVGRSVKKKVESWYRRRVKTPVEHLTTELGLDGMVNKVSPLSFIGNNRHYCSTPQPNNSIKSDQASDDTDDVCSLSQGQNEFEDLRKLVKQGGDFCKDLAAVLQERSELEAQYAKGLSKLSGKLLKASKEATGSVAHAWQAVAVQIDTQAELHRLWSTALLDEVAKPLRNSTDTQHKIRKSVEGLVEKTTRNLAEWRTAETKSKRQCFSSSKEFEKIQECSTSLMSNANLHSTLNLSIANGNGNTTTNNSVLAEVRARSRILSVPPTDKDPIKLEAKRRKAEEAVRRADIEYYTFCVRSERARLEWEGAIRNGSTCLRTLEEEKLALLKELALKYFQHFNEFIPKLVRSAECLEEPIRLGSVDQDMHSVFDIRRHAGVEQLLPDFYAEDTSNLMKKERRQEALQKFLYLIKQDLEREKKGAVGIENLAKAIAEAPKVDNAHHDISDKVYYMKSMLMYLEGARCKIENALADIEGRQRNNISITQYMRYQRDKQGLPQTILKVPTWARDECLNCNESTGSSSPDWHEQDHRGAGDGTSNRQDTDFDEFSSEESEQIEEVFDETEEPKGSDLINVPSIGRCRVIYDYDANMFDELTIRSGEMINVHDKQEDGWWLGELNGVVGIFPATYVELVVVEITDTSDKV